MANEDRGVQRIPISFEKGVIRSQESSRIPPGSVRSLLNWVPEPTGELRVRRSWEAMNQIVPPDGGGIIYSVPKIQGIGYSPYSARRWVVAHRGSPITVRFMVQDLDPGAPGDAPPHRPPSTSGTWVDVDHITINSPDSNVISPAVAFATGLGRVWMAHEDKPTLFAYNGSVLTAITGSPQSRAVAVHGNRVYAGGGGALPYRLFYSDINTAVNAADWGANNYLDVGSADGEPIEDLATFGDDLLIAKEHGIWLLSGEGKQSFDLHPLLDGGGARGRCLVPTPYGAIIMGDQHIWLYDGSVPKLISEPIEDLWSPETHVTYSPLAGGRTYRNDFVSGGFLGRRCYMTDQTTIFVYDFATQSWTTETCDDTVGVVSAGNGLLLMGPNRGSEGRMLNFRAVDSPRRNDFGRQVDESFSVETPTITAAGPARAMVFRHLELMIRQRGTGTAQLKITPTVDGKDQPQRLITVGSAGLQRLRVDLPGIDGYSIKFLIEQDVAATDGPNYDIEEASLVVTLAGFDR